MNPYFELPNLARNFRRPHADRIHNPARQTDEFLSVGAYRLINGLGSVVRHSVGWMSRAR